MPVASLVQREVRSPLEAWRIPIQRLHSSRETTQSTGKIFSYHFESSPSHSNFMLCTELALLSASPHSTAPPFHLIPARTYSYPPCIYMSLFRGFSQTLRTMDIVLYHPCSPPWLRACPERDAWVWSDSSLIQNSD